MLRGSSTARVDEKGRLKIPTAFRRLIEEKYGRDCFVTSLTGDNVRVYPMPVWEEIEKKMLAQPSMHPIISRLKNLVNYFGQSAAMDEQGRVLIPPQLRERSGMNGEVSVIGNQTWLEIWNREKFEANVVSRPMTEEEQQILSQLGI